MLKGLSRLFLGLGLGVSLAAGIAVANESAPKKPKRTEQSVKITVTPVGPSQETVEAAKFNAERSEAVRRELKDTKYRLMSLEYVENGTSAPTRYRVYFYDYTNDRTLVAEGAFNNQEPVTVREAAFQPIPNDEEFEEAVRIIQTDARFAVALRNQTLKAFRPMPDVSVLSGTIERLVNVGLNAQGATQNEVVSVSLKRGTVIRYPEGAPSQSRAAPDACGIPDAGQTTTGSGTAGQYNLTVTQGQTTLWEMTVVRPSASSGTRKSGIEVQNVKYKGKSVLKRGHAPVLNVQYNGGECGPYRDWQFQEDMFQTPASGNIDPAPGVRIVAPGQVATTALESGSDSGNFRGVAIYTQNNETVLISEMQAGWYRYIMEWRFADDGTIRPRYGFGATDNSCVCFVHNHHVYWRFDFDIVQPNNKIFQVERGRKFQTPINTELKRLRNYQTNRSLLIQNSAGDEAYMLVPSISDGKADGFGVNDMWVLRYKNVVGGTAVQNEIDDGINCTTCQSAFIQIDPFINNESVVDQDLVVWYGAHFVHADGANLIDPDRSGLVLSGSHVVGPDIRPVRW
jgi:negative regulator of replication initiation